MNPAGKLGILSAMTLALVFQRLDRLFPLGD